MTPADLRYLFSRSLMTLESNLEGFSHEESLIAPQPAGNCANWVLGHVVFHRDFILNTLGAECLWTLAEGKVYATGSAPLAAAHARKLEKLRDELQRAHERLLTVLESKTEADLSAEITTPRGTITLGQRLAFLAGHELYHAGQIALLRRMLGKPGAI
jgi:uncharacterized damage-inducible protein DinB